MINNLHYNRTASLVWRKLKGLNVLNETEKMKHQKNQETDVRNPER